MKKILITGTAGFIGFHLANLLLEKGYIVHGYDGLTDYYDVDLKRHRHEILSKQDLFSHTEGMLEDEVTLEAVSAEFAPEVIIHLAAQAGVRYSLENPRSYINSNIVGTFNILEVARKLKVQHLLMASTSSVYGANVSMPFGENDKADAQLTIYAATKKATENMAHSYSHLWNIPTTMFRFFTVYGPWGRPDLALYKFVKSMTAGEPIDLYNNGQMFRDFTYVGDLVEAIRLLVRVVPEGAEDRKADIDGDSLSSVAPFRVVNIGNSEKVNLMDFVEAIEECLGEKAIYNYMPMQTGDVPATWANASLLHTLTGYKPTTHFKTGIAKFVDWYKGYYR